MNRRSPTLAGNLGGSAVERPKSTGWGPGEHAGQGGAAGGGWEPGREMQPCS